jgi:Xaa-Pro aminopeptidase
MSGTRPGRNRVKVEAQLTSVSIIRPMSKLARLSFALLLLVAPSVRAGASELSDDLAARRARLLQRLGADTMAVVLSAPPRVYSGDVDYEYRQDSNFYYLTGLAQEDSVLVLMPGNGTKREILFVKDKDPAREHWSGRTLSRDEARARTGIATVLSSGSFDAFIAAMLGRRGWGTTVDGKEAGAFFAALATGQARLAVVLDSSGDGTPPTPTEVFLQRTRERYVGFVPIDISPLLTDLRLVKTPYELAQLTTATEISVDAQMAGMRATAPGVFEYQVKAAIEAVHRGRGAVSTAYPSIVGSGPNATILHYPESTRQMQAGDLLLVDAAANYGYQASDITRTWPVSGRFTETQKDVYRVVFDAQQEAIKAARPGATLASIHDRTVESLKAGLLRLGLITDTASEQYRMWFTHSTSHYIGIDVHDVGERTRPLAPGMTFTIEPGLYIRQVALDTLPRTPENLALIEKIQPAVTKYLDIGVRIEDSFVMEADGVRNLSKRLPRTLDDVEAFLRQERVGTGGR